MSPAMVDFKSPASASSKLHPDRPGSGSSIKGRTPSSSSYTLFNRSGIPEPSPIKDRGNLGHGISVSSSACRPPLFPSFSAIEKPAPAQRLSAPRFQKQRKHSVASRARPATTALDGCSVPEFNPFRSELLGGDHIDRAEDRRTQSVQDQLYDWKPFVPDASSRLNSGAGFLFGDASSLSNASSCNTEPETTQGTAFGVVNNGRGNASTGHFIFGSGMEEVSNLSHSSSKNSSAQSLGSIDSTKSECTELTFGPVPFSDSNVKTVEIGKPVGGSVCPVSADNVFSDSGVFEFGISAKKDVHLCQHSSLESDNDSFGNLKYQKPVNEKSEKLNSSFFGLESDEKKSSHSSKNLSFGSDVGLFKEKPDRTMKMDQPNSSKEDCQKACTGFNVFGSFEKLQANAVQSSSLCFSENSVSNIPEDLRKLKIESSIKDENGKKDSSVFVFGSGVRNFTCASKRSSFDVFDGLFSKLPEKMEKLNLRSSADEVLGDTESVISISGSSLKKGAQFAQTSSSDLDEGVFSRLPFELRKLNLQSLGKEEHRNDGHCDFIFSSDVNNNTKSRKSSPPSFHEGSISNLPNEIGKMKLSSSGCEDDTQNRRQGDTQNKHGCSAAFMFASNMDTATSTETSSPSQVPDFPPFEPDLNFNNMHTRLEQLKMEFRNPIEDTSWLTKDKLFAEPHKNIAFGMGKGESKGVRLKKKRGKSKQSAAIHSGIDKQFVSLGKGSEGNLEQDATGEYSPMDYSPYQETSGSNQCSREESVPYDESLHFHSLYTSTDTQRLASTDGKEEEFVLTTEHICPKEGILENKDADCYGLSAHSAGHCNLRSCLEDEMVPEIGKRNCAAKDANFGHDIQTRASSVESKSFSFDPRIRQPTAEGGSGFTFMSNSQDVGQSNFLFGAKSSVQCPLSASKSSYRGKVRVKSDHRSHINTKVPLLSPMSNLFLFPNAHDPKQKVIGNHESAGKVNELETNPESTATSAACFAAQEACDKWRLRGNQAYADGHLFKAEDYYSRGVNSLSLKEISKSCCLALMLCYSNRAATRMSLGRLREALVDCYMAIAIDPSFLRARVRAGNIHLSLGESGDALQHFQKCLQLDNEAKSDQKILLEAANGLEKAQKLNDLMNHSSVFLAKRTSSDATKALEIISEALSIGPFSESLLEMKAEALVMMRKYEEAIHACEQPLEFAVKNSVATESNCQLKDNDCPESVERSNVSLWRWRIISKSYFYLGKLEAANELLLKHEKAKPVIEKDPESSTSFPVIVHELLRLKTAGNEAFQAGRYLEAVELYTAALVLNTESRPFTAICFCNRAAAFQALGQITDAVADCSLAIALDSSYRKAISRRATLHEMIRDYRQATTDLCRLISLLEKNSEDKYNTCGAVGRSSSNVSDLNQVHKRLFTVEEEARKGAKLDMYIILGIERSSSTADVRKAYRKAALRHHPDKAGQFLARNENGDDSVWKEVADEVYSDADRLFKMIGEAYTILVDPSKRLQYDAEEDLRTMKKGYGGNSSPRTPANSFGSQYDQSVDQRHWGRCGSMQQRWSESTQSNR